jgi:hypothetical protein
MRVTGEDRSTRNDPLLLDWKLNPEILRKGPAWVALWSESSNPGTVIIVRDTAHRRPILI